MKKPMRAGKVLLALLLVALMMVPSVLAFAAEEDTGKNSSVSDFLGGLFGGKGEEEKTDTSSDSDKNGVEKLIDIITPAPTAPDNVREAFSVADDAYAENHSFCFAVNTAQNIVIAYERAEDGTFTKPSKALVCSCGLPSSPTKQGVWRTTDTYRWRALNGGVWGQYATRITGPYLFHSVPYYQKDPSTLETEEYNKLGQNASAGCVRLAAHDAKWVKNRCPEGTLVYIYDGADVKEPLAKPIAQKIDPSSPYAGWDPTDPSADNPWKANK